MEKNWFDLVVAKPEEGRPQIFMAPAWTHLSTGRKVVVERFAGDDEGELAVVIFAVTVSNKFEDDVVQTAKALTGDEYWPLRKVVGSYGTYNYDCYEEVETTEED